MGQTNPVLGLYRGYKRRNARLDALASSAPPYLATSAVPLANQTFVDVESESDSQDLHNHLFVRFNLLDRVVRARKLHHSRFFSDKADYGHAHYLDSLQSQKFVVLRAFGRLERRTVV